MCEVNYLFYTQHFTAVHTLVFWGGVLDGVSRVPPSAVLMKGSLTVARPARHSAAQNTQPVTQRCGTEYWEEHHTGLRVVIQNSVCVNFKHREQTVSEQAWIRNTV